MRKLSLSAPLRVALTLLTSLTLGACSGSDNGSATNLFVIGNSGFAAAGSTPLAVNGVWLAFMADEAASGGLDLNNDGQAGGDQVAIAVNTVTKAETNLGVAATAATWVGAELYLVVDELLDNFDHDGGGTIAELVLMHWNSSLTGPVYVETLDRGSATSMVAVGSTLFFASARAGTQIGESSLLAIDKAFPETPRAVFTQDLNGARTPRLLGQQEGLVLLTYDETVEGVALNGDGDTLDTHVLVLLDGTGLVDAAGYSLLMRNTGLAISGATSPWRAASQGANNWLFGFLVDEASQNVNLNVFGANGLPLSWQHGSCTLADSDQTDEVLHVVRFASWDLDPVVDLPVNTGLAGDSRVLIVGDAVATICPEADENNCVFNGDTDGTDRILRWIRMDSVVTPFSVNGPEKSPARLVALDTTLPGPAQAVGELDGAFVVQVDEAFDGRNHDNDAGTNRKLLAWLDPQDAGPAWDFNHSTATQFYAVATWMGEQPGHTRLGIAFAESSNADDLNGDGDLIDAMPTWADLSGAPRRLTFLGRFMAADKNNAGITLANGHGFFRFSEIENGAADSNGNGTTTDILLVRVSFANGIATNMGILNTLPRPAIETEPDGTGGGGAFMFDESILGTDLNGDGDSGDFVPRFFQLP